MDAWFFIVPVFSTMFALMGSICYFASTKIQDWNFLEFHIFLSLLLVLTALCLGFFDGDRCRYRLLTKFDNYMSAGLWLTFFLFSMIVSSFNGFWLDEWLQIQVFQKFSSPALAAISHLQPPLFYEMLNFSRQFIPPRDFLLRLPVHFIAATVVSLIYRQARLFGIGVSVSLCGVLLILLSPFFIWHSIDLRPYMLAFALSFTVFSCLEDLQSLAIPTSKVFKQSVLLWAILTLSLFSLSVQPLVFMFLILGGTLIFSRTQNRWMIAFTAGAAICTYAPIFFYQKTFLRGLQFFTRNIYWQFFTQEVEYYRLLEFVITYYRPWPEILLVSVGTIFIQKKWRTPYFALFLATGFMLSIGFIYKIFIDLPQNMDPRYFFLGLSGCVFSCLVAMKSNRYVSLICVFALVYSAFFIPAPFVSRRFDYKLIYEGINRNLKANDDFLFIFNYACLRSSMELDFFAGSLYLNPPLNPSESAIDKFFHIGDRAIKNLYFTLLKSPLAFDVIDRFELLKIGVKPNQMETIDTSTAFYVAHLDNIPLSVVLKAWAVILDSTEKRPFVHFLNALSMKLDGASKDQVRNAMIEAKECAITPTLLKALENN